MTREEVDKWFLSQGFIKNRFGHYFRPLIPNVRIKVLDSIIKYQRSHRDESGKLKWSTDTRVFYKTLKRGGYK